ncbi:MAG: flavoprotein [Phycisphaerae bacterium]|jgi:phosphopantothenoylcysteine decarboxylase/phosphopantothenate--cysteine ligase
MAKKDSAFSGLNVLLGVSGGVAVFKAVDLASKLTAAGANVDTVMTESACKFVLPKSFEAVTGRAVYTSMWENPQGFQIGHIRLADSADVVVVAPATANIIGKAANGICDDLLSTVLCACWQKKILFAPAMNEKMWQNPAVQWNVKTLNEMGFETIGPEKGRLACGTEGIGRMSEVADIIKRLEKMTKK